MEDANAQLIVQVRPAGAKVYVDGLRSGTSPVSLDLPSGQHDVRVELEGYKPLRQTVDLAAGAPSIIDQDLTQKETASALDQVPTVAPTSTVMPTREPTLTPTSTPIPDRDPPLPDLAVKSLKIELETGNDCDYRSTQLGLSLVVENRGNADAAKFVVEANGELQTVEAGLAAGKTVSLWFEGYQRDGESRVIIDAGAEVQESDKDNNLVSQRLPIPTLPPPCTPLPTVPSSNLPTPSVVVAASPTPKPSPPPAAVSVYERQVGIATYPYGEYLSEAWNEAFNMPYRILDRGAYEASNPSPAGAIYRSIVLENEYLKLTFLPELGGRLYEVFFKPMGHPVTYRNPVLKPSPWGPTEQGWWLAAGGFEWCLPVAEHGYEWGIPWTAQVSQDASSATVTLRDTTDDDRVRAAIAVRLVSGAGYFTIRPRLENPTSAPLAMKYWTNAMLAPGGRNAPSAQLRFVLPDAVTAVTVHSRGDETLPAHNERLSWPVHDGRDLSQLGNWNRWLGFFQDPALGSFMAVYDEAYDEGMVRVSPHDPAASRGVKGFGFGWHDPIPASNWTDDGSSYVEIHGGPAPTFDDSVVLPPGGHLQWHETWYPVAGLGQLSFANEIAALDLKAGGGQAEIAVATSRPWQGDLVLLTDGQERWRKAVSLIPGHAFRDLVSLGDANGQAGSLLLRVEGPNGDLLAEYETDYNPSGG
jgi:hypothetical protein